MSKSKLDEVKKFLKDIGMPKAQQSDICALSILAMSGIKPNDKWKSATNDWIRIHDIIAFIGANYGIAYAENSRETFRKQAMHSFRTAALIEDNGEATNSPNYRYRITDEMLCVLHSIGTRNLKKQISCFLTQHEELISIYASKKKMAMMPVKINGSDFQFSAGKHNELQKHVIEEFAPRFAPNSECLYVGDTINKSLVKNADKLSQLGLDITLHDKMPDVILYREDENWIYFIECVTSVGPMDSKRVIEINEMSKRLNAEKIFVTAFSDFATYKKFADSLAWETEVWIATMPEHMIHLNGDKFLGSRNS